MRGLLHDLRFAIRTLTKTPHLTLVAVGTLALAIGSITAIFSLVNAVLLRPLPFSDSDRLAIVWRAQPARGRQQLPLSYPDFDDLRNRATGFESMAAVAFQRFSLTSEGKTPERIDGAVVTSNFFHVFQQDPLLGRGFLSAEDAPGTERVVILSHALWSRRFAASPQAIGKSVQLDGLSYQVVGVMPASFRLLGFLGENEAWIPFGNDPFRDRRYARGVNSMGVFGRLQRDVDNRAAQTELDAVSIQLESENPGVNAGSVFRLAPLKEQAVENIRASLWLLFSAAGFVLLIACANVANLILARASTREAEMAVRSALGAGRLRLIRQSLVESALLAVVGTAFGLVLALWGIDFLVSLPIQDASHYTPFRVTRQQVGLDFQVLLFACGLTAGSALLCGLAPAIRASRVSPGSSLNSLAGARVAPQSQGRAPNLLVVAEVAVAVVILVGASLVTKSFVKLMDVDLGFRPDNVLSASVSLPPSRYLDDGQVVRTYREILSRLRGMPGVLSAGAVEFLPLAGADGTTGVFPEGQPIPPAGQELRAHYRTVTPGYFESIGIVVKGGRGFTDRDTTGAPPVALVNETLARQCWPGESPIGKRLALTLESLKYYRDRAPDLDLSLGMREVVGVVSDVRHSRLDAAPFPEMYTPLQQRPVRDLSLVLRAGSDPVHLIDAFRREIWRVDSELPVSNIETLSSIVSESVSRPRFNVTLMTALAGMALVLATVGVFGVLSCSVTQRRREIGIRMALGAKGSDIAAMIIGRGMGLTGAGVVVGWILAFGLARLLRSLLFEVGPNDPTVFLFIPLFMAAVSLLACYPPARRGARVDPIRTLRLE